MSGLQLMVQSYTSNPQFGDVTKFKEELEKITLQVQQLESDLYAVNNIDKFLFKKVHNFSKGREGDWQIYEQKGFANFRKLLNIDDFLKLYLVLIWQ